MKIFDSFDRSNQPILNSKIQKVTPLPPNSAVLDPSFDPSNVAWITDGSSSILNNKLLTSVTDDSDVLYPGYIINGNPTGGFPYILEQNNQQYTNDFLAFIATGVDLEDPNFLTNFWIYLKNKYSLSKVFNTSSKTSFDYDSFIDFSSFGDALTSGFDSHSVIHRYSIIDGSIIEQNGSSIYPITAQNLFILNVDISVRFLKVGSDLLPANWTTTTGALADNFYKVANIYNQIFVEVTVLLGAVYISHDGVFPDFLNDIRMPSEVLTTSQNVPYRIGFGGFVNFFSPNMKSISSGNLSKTVFSFIKNPGTIRSALIPEGEASSLLFGPSSTVKVGFPYGGWNLDLSFLDDNPRAGGLNFVKCVRPHSVPSYTLSLIFSNELADTPLLIDNLDFQASIGSSGWNVGKINVGGGSSASGNTFDQLIAQQFFVLGPSIFGEGISAP